MPGVPVPAGWHPLPGATHGRMCAMTVSRDPGIYLNLRARIVGGTLAPGTWLSESGLAESFGVRREMVREALRRLQADGLVYVSLGWGGQVGGSSQADAAAGYELRVLLEGYGADRAATGGHADIRRLRRLCAAMESRLARLDDKALDDIAQLNRDLHSEIHLASQVAVLPSMLDQVMRVGAAWETFRRYSHSDLHRSFAQHREIVDAIEAGDGVWARAVMSAHILAARAIQPSADEQPVGD